MMFLWKFPPFCCHLFADFRRISNNVCTKRWIKSSPEYPRFLQPPWAGSAWAIREGLTMSLGANIERPKRFLDADFFLPRHLQVFYVYFFLERMYTDVLLMCSMRRRVQIWHQFFGIICCILGKDIEQGLKWQRIWWKAPVGCFLLELLEEAL